MTAYGTLTTYASDGPVEIRLCGMRPQGEPRKQGFKSRVGAQTVEAGPDVDENQKARPVLGSPFKARQGFLDIPQTSVNFATSTWSTYVVSESRSMSARIAIARSR